jgi:hypothetical protein
MLGWSTRSAPPGQRGAWLNPLIGLVLILALTGAPGDRAQAQTGQTADDTAELQARIEALRSANAAVVGVRATAVDDARSIETLGRRRQGSGVVIDVDGLVLTIGYLTMIAVCRRAWSPTTWPPVSACCKRSPR